MLQGLESKMQIQFPVSCQEDTGFDNLLIDSARLENSYYEGLDIVTDDGKVSGSDVSSDTDSDSNSFEGSAMDAKEKLRLKGEHHLLKEYRKKYKPHKQSI